MNFFKSIKKGIKTKYQNKISLISVTSVFLVVLLTLIVTYKGINELYVSSSKEAKEGLRVVNDEYLENYINITNSMLESKIQRFFDEQAMAADIYQRFLDNEKELEPLIKSMKNTTFFQDNLQFNGRWYQNSKNEDSVVLVQRYLLNSDNSIKEEVKKEIEKSAFLDLYIPSIYKNGSKKLWMYYSGGVNASFMRITPWTNAGENVDKVYPWHTDKENWDAFNPGLVEAWQNCIKNNNYYNTHLSDLAIVKTPSQDGGSGKLIMSLNYPLWDKERKNFRGSISVDVDLEEIINYTAELKLAKTGFAFMLQENGNVLAINNNGEKILGLKALKDSSSKSSNGVGYNSMDRFLKDSTYDSVKKIKNPSDNNVNKSEININNKDYILVQKNLKALNSFSVGKGMYKSTYTLCFLVPKAEIYESLNNLLEETDKIKKQIIVQQIFIITSILLICGILIYIISSKVTENLKKLQNAAEQIKNGDYDLDIDVKTEDEIGSLADAFRSMVIEIKSTVQKLLSQNEKMKTEIKYRLEKEEQIKYLQEYDTLTGLPKKKNLQLKLKDLINNNKKGYVFFIGIDNFRKVNEILGHIGGDEVLKIVADRLKNFAKNDEIIYKITGDEFVLLVNEEKEDLDVIIGKTEAIMKSLKNEIKVLDKKVFITTSIGISSFPNDSSYPEDVLKFASFALNKAKENGKGKYQFYDAEINKNTEKRIEMVEQLRGAVKNNELELLYQPQIDFSSKKVIGMEALIRWNNKIFGKVMPIVFISLAEETGIINEIGEWVLYKACKDIKELHKRGIKDISVAVNVSPIQFDDENFSSKIINALKESSLESKFLEIEVTESVFINDTDKVSKMLNFIRSQGVKISVDDFGTGYSCLSYIKKLPIDKLKIDRSFIKDIPEKDNGALSKIIIEMGKSLGLKVVAEGVETKAQEAFLVERNCDEAQGYLYSKPITFEELYSFIVNWG